MGQKICGMPTILFVLEIHLDQLPSGKSGLVTLSGLRKFSPKSIDEPVQAITEIIQNKYFT